MVPYSPAETMPLTDAGHTFPPVQRVAATGEMHSVTR